MLSDRHDRRPLGGSNGNHYFKLCKNVYFAPFVMKIIFATRPEQGKLCIFTEYE